MMWMVTLNKRDFLESVTTGPSIDIIDRAWEYRGGALSEEDGKIAVFWGSKPLSRRSMPTLAVSDIKQIRDLLAAVNAGHNAVSPFSAFCRLMDFESAKHYLNPVRNDNVEAIVEAVAMLSLVEVQLRSEGQMKASRIGPAACKRTLCFAWAKALNAGVGANQLDRLPRLWAEAFELSNRLHGIDDDGPAIYHFLPVLAAAARALEPHLDLDPSDRLIRSIVNQDTQQRDAAWLDASKTLSLDLSLQELEVVSREERGAYLQRLLKDSQRWSSGDSRAAGQGFLATQIAPGSLEHLELLLVRGGPEAAFWYVFFATLQNPTAILNAFGGTGRRIVREIADREEITSFPRADISLDEFKILSRFGSDDLRSKLGHSNEIEIELLPLVTGSFRFARNQGVRATDPNSTDKSRILVSLHQMSALVSQAISELNPKEPPPSSKPVRSKKARF